MNMLSEISHEEDKINLKLIKLNPRRTRINDIY